MAQTKKFLDITAVERVAGWVDTNYTKQEEGKSLSSNDYTNADKEKLQAVESGAQANVLEAVKVNGTALEVTDKGVDIDLSDYATATSVEGKVDKVTGKGLSTNDLTDELVEKINNAITSDTLTQAVAEAGHIKASFVESLPETGLSNIIYFCPDGEEEGNVYAEYVWVTSGEGSQGAWEKIGSKQVDFSGVWSKDELVAVTDEELDEVLNAI